MTQNWQDVTLKALENELLWATLNNDPKAAMFLIKYFHERFTDIGQDGCPLGSMGVLCQYMAHVFEKMMVENWTAEQALGLKKQRGRYNRSSTTERDYLLTANVILLMRNGNTWEIAIMETANCYFKNGEGERVVETAYALHKDLFKICNFKDNELLKLINSFTPAIKAL